MAKNDEKKPAVETTAKPDEKAKAPETVPAKDEPKKAKAAEKVEKTEGMVKMQKGDTSLHVHPTTVKAHKKAGWKVA